MQQVTADMVAELVVDSSGGGVTRASLDAVNGDLTLAGYKSVYLLTLLENMESKLGIIIDPTEDPSFLASVATITAYVQASLTV